MCNDSIRCRRHSGSIGFIIYGITLELSLQSSFLVLGMYSSLLWLMVMGKGKLELITNAR